MTHEQLEFLINEVTFYEARTNTFHPDGVEVLKKLINEKSSFLLILTNIMYWEGEEVVKLDKGITLEIE